MAPEKAIRKDEQKTAARLITTVQPLKIDKKGDPFLHTISSKKEKNDFSLL